MQKNIDKNTHSLESDTEFDIADDLLMFLDEQVTENTEGYHHVNIEVSPSKFSEYQIANQEEALNLIREQEDFIIQERCALMIKEIELEEKEQLIELQKRELEEQKEITSRFKQEENDINAKEEINNAIISIQILHKIERNILEQSFLLDEERIDLQSKYTALKNHISVLENNNITNASDNTLLVIEEIHKNKEEIINSYDNLNEKLENTNHVLTKHFNDLSIIENNNILNTSDNTLLIIEEIHKNKEEIINSYDNLDEKLENTNRVLAKHFNEIDEKITDAIDVQKQAKEDVNNQTPILLSIQNLVQTNAENNFDNTLIIVNEIHERQKKVVEQEISFENERNEPIKRANISLKWIEGRIEHIINSDNKINDIIGLLRTLNDNSKKEIVREPQFDEFRKSTDILIYSLMFLSIALIVYAISISIVNDEFYWLGYLFIFVLLTAILFLRQFLKRNE